jgi:hypothetical protein
VSDTDLDQGIDLATASSIELAEFAQRHGVEFERLERCRQYLRTAAPIGGEFKLLALTGESETGAVPALVLRLVRDDGAWVELPTDFPSEHLAALLEILDES